MDIMTTAVILATSDSSDGGRLLISSLAFASPFAAFWYAHRTLYRRYRNQDQRYRYEHTTVSTIDDLQRWDTFTRERKRLRNRIIEGSNVGAPDARAAHVAIKEEDGHPLEGLTKNDEPQ